MPAPITSDSSDIAIARTDPSAHRCGLLAACSVFLIAAYLAPLTEWFHRAAGSMMYSCALLVPFISAYLIREKRAELPRTLHASPVAGSIPLVIGLACLGWYWATDGAHSWHPQDRLALVLSSFLALLVSAGLFLAGEATMRAVAFPISFTVFILPLPTVVEQLLKVFFQYSSAEAAVVIFSLLDMPYLRHGLSFELPGITLEVAQECSGINSSYVLFITSLVAGRLFLRKAWNRVFIALFVVPLAILRNGLRIVTIGFLCVHGGPDMIHSVFHRRGGPLFFALSLVPFFLVLFWLRKREGGIENRG